MKRDWTEIIPSLSDWRPEPILPENLAAFEGTYALAIGYVTLFWPSFTEYDGMIFRAEELDKESLKNIKSWLTSYEGDKQAVETMLNHLHVIDIQHPGLWKEATEPQIRFLGQMLKEMWAYKLLHDFPEKRFTVEFFEGEEGKLEDYQVTFYQR